MRLLITGGLGFIGSNFIRYILNNHPDYHVTNLDVITYAGNPANLRDIEGNPRYRFVKGDISREEDVKKVMKKDVDVVINFAAETHVDRSIVDPENFIRTNIVGTYTLLEFARKLDIELFLQISTDEVYGSIEEGSFVETDSLNPSSPYSASKAGADLLVKAYHKTYGLPILIVRSTNNFGPYQHPEKLIPLTIVRALRDMPIPVYGDGMNVRDWIYVEDNCSAIDLILHKGASGEIYNVGAGNEKTNLEVVNLILSLLNKPSSLVTFVEDRPGHDRRYSLNTDKVRSLGWKPMYGFEEALQMTVKWYLDNQWWWKPLLEM